MSKNLSKRTEKFAFLQDPKDKSIMEQIDLFRDFVIDTNHKGKSDIENLFQNLQKNLTHPEIKEAAHNFNKSRSGGLLKSIGNNTQKALTNALVSMYTTSVRTSSIVPNQAERLVQNAVAKNAISKEASMLLRGEKPYGYTIITEEGKRMKEAMIEGKQEIKALEAERDHLKTDNNIIKRAYNNIVGNLRTKHKFNEEQIKDLHKDNSIDSSKNLNQEM